MCAEECLFKSIHLFIYLFIYLLNPHLKICLLLLERGRKERGRERETERNINQLPLVRTPIEDHTSHLRMCPDWESNPQCLGVWDNAPTNWATQPGPLQYYLEDQQIAYNLNATSESVNEHIVVCIIEHHGAIQHWVNMMSCIRTHKDANIYLNKKHMENTTTYRPRVGSKV